VRPSFASLGSGSGGNALLIEFGDTLLMIDCGLPQRVVAERMALVGRDPRDLTAVLVTHEHADHVRGVAGLCRRYGTPVWTTHGTAAAGPLHGLEVNIFSCHRAFALGAIIVEPFPVPHDAREPCQFVFVAGGRRLGVLADTGHVTAHIIDRLAGCDALALECNHELDALWRGPYPAAVKARVASPLGHLDNLAAARLLERIRHPELQWVTALHLSAQNNSPGEVRDRVEAVLAPSCVLHLATQERPTEWLALA
jgi:phosphoribosyl 1,2-cyclic phosphodiesterase